MKKLFILLIVILLIVVGCRSDVPSFEDDYPMMKDTEHVFEKVNYTTALNLILDGTGVLLIAFDTNKYHCPYCVEILPILNEVAIEFDNYPVYYLDIYRMRFENTSEYRLLLGYIDSKVGDLEVRDGKTTLVVPDVYFIKNGEIIGHHIGTVKDDEGNYVLDMDDTHKQSLTEIYHNLFTNLNNT